jgi:hypothetical protein
MADLVDPGRDCVIVYPTLKRWGYKLNGREFVAYKTNREAAVELFATVLGVAVEHVDPIVVELTAHPDVTIFDGRSAPGA